MRIAVQGAAKAFFPAVQGDDLPMGTFKGQRGWAFKAEFKLRLRRPVFDPFPPSRRGEEGEQSLFFRLILSPFEPP